MQTRVFPLRWSGYVDSDATDRNVVMEGHIYAGVDGRVTPPTPPRTVIGLLQFDLDADVDLRSPGVELFLTGRDDTFLNEHAAGTWRVSLLDPALDREPSALKFADVRDAPALHDVDPALHDADVGPGQPNLFRLSPAAAASLAERAQATGRATFRVVGTIDRSGVRHIFAWDGRPEAAPSLRIGGQEESSVSADNVFKFVGVRPVQRSAEVTATRFARYSATAQSPLHQAIEALPADRELEGLGSRRGRAIDLAVAFMTSDQYVGTHQAVVDAARAASAEKTVRAAKKAACTVLAVDDLAVFLASDAAIALRNGLWDSLYAQTLAPEARPDDRNHIVPAVRALHYLELLAAQDDKEAPIAASILDDVTTVVPIGVVPPADGSAKDGGGDAVSDVIERLEGLHGTVLALRDAVADVQNVDRVYRAEQLRSFTSPDLDVSSTAATQTNIGVGQLTGPVLRVPPAFVGPIFLEAAQDGEPVAAPGIEARSIIVPARRSWVFGDFGQANLKPETQTLLATHRAALDTHPPALLASTLDADIVQQVRAFIQTIPATAMPYVVQRPEFHALAATVPLAFSQLLPSAYDPAPTPGSPTARGIRPLGMGDLLIVQQELLGYAPGEIAHIENVLQSEHKSRIHSRLRETEEIEFIETENLEETERDLQTTERFELQKETEQTIESQLSIEAGLSVTASYGVVSATATANFAYEQSQSDARKVSSQFAKEVVDRSVSRILKRVREQRTRRTLERFEERNEHGFDNSQGAEHVIGVYRWVDKYYRARTINYGRRLMIEFIVPEPAAFYKHTQAHRPLTGVTAVRPEAPTVWGRPLQPSDLHAWNFEDFVAAYNVQGVAPYPAENVRVGTAFADAPGAGQDKNMDYGKVSDKPLLVPPGYVCEDIYGHFTWQGITGTNFFADCSAAGETFGSLTGDGLSGAIPVSVKGWFTAFHANLVASCYVTEEAIVAWQLKTFEAILSAYQNALADYNEQVAAAEVAAGVAIVGRNPVMNRKIERDELRKSVLRVLTDEWAQTRVGGTWRFDELFDAMSASGAFGYPEFDIDESMVEGQIIQFFEQAFEWNNVTYRFYPYFWGRKANWKDTFLDNDTDPLFTDFLRAGAARVVVPVHPAYTEAVLHYMYTSEIWNGDRPPTLDDPLYVSIVDEIKSDTGADLSHPLPNCPDADGYPCIVDEWQVKVPTSLVYLQKDGVLPSPTE